MVLRSPKCGKKISLTLLHHHQPEPLRQDRMIHAFMFFTPNSDPNIWIKSRLIRPGNVFSIFYFNFGDPVWIVVSVSCSYLTGAAPGVVFCCWSPSASGFDVLCVQRWYSAYLGCNEWLFELLLPFYYLYSVCPFSSDLWHQQGIFIHTTAAHWIFSLFQTILCKP